MSVQQWQRGQGRLRGDGAERRPERGRAWREGLAGLGAPGQRGLMEVRRTGGCQGSFHDGSYTRSPAPGPPNRLLSCSPSAESGRKVILISNFL